MYASWGLPKPWFTVGKSWFLYVTKGHGHSLSWSTVTSVSALMLWLFLTLGRSRELSQPKVIAVDGDKLQHSSPKLAPTTRKKRQDTLEKLGMADFPSSIFFSWSSMSFTGEWSYHNSLIDRIIRRDTFLWSFPVYAPMYRWFTGVPSGFLDLKVDHA